MAGEPRARQRSNDRGLPLIAAARRTPARDSGDHRDPGSSFTHPPTANANRSPRRNPRFLSAPFGTIAFYFPRSAFDEIAADAYAHRIGELRCPHGQGIPDGTMRNLVAALIASFDRSAEVS